MCKDFIELKDGKIVKSKGRLLKGRWALCLECGFMRFGKTGNLLEHIKLGRKKRDNNKG